jgi:hypothetical protein
MFILHARRNSIEGSFRRFGTKLLILQIEILKYNFCGCINVCFFKRLSWTTLNYKQNIISGSVSKLDQFWKCPKKRGLSNCFQSAIKTMEVVRNSEVIFQNITQSIKTKTNSVALARERTITSERPPPVVEVSAKFYGYRVSTGQRNRSPRMYFLFSRPLLFFASRSSFVLMRLSEPRCRSTTS